MSDRNTSERSEVGISTADSFTPGVASSTPSSRAASFIKRPSLSTSADALNIDRFHANSALVSSLLIELRTTEEKFLDDLRMMAIDYLGQLRERQILSREDAWLLFGNVESLQMTHEALLGRLPPAQPAGALPSTALTLSERVRATAKAFISLAPFLAMHATFADNYEKAALDALRRLQRNPSFSRFCKQAEEGDGALPLQALLIKPIQRLCKYPLFFERLRHSYSSLVEEPASAAADEDDMPAARADDQEVLASLRESETLIRRLADRVNSTLANAKAQERLVELLERLSCLSLLAPHRQLQLEARARFVELPPPSRLDRSRGSSGSSIGLESGGGGGGGSSGSLLSVASEATLRRSASGLADGKLLLLSDALLLVRRPRIARWSSNSRLSAANFQPPPMACSRTASASFNEDDSNAAVEAGKPGLYEVSPLGPRSKLDVRALLSLLSLQAAPLSDAGPLSDVTEAAHDACTRLGFDPSRCLLVRGRPSATEARATLERQSSAAVSDAERPDPEAPLSPAAAPPETPGRPQMASGRAERWFLVELGNEGAPPVAQVVTRVRNQCATCEAISNELADRKAGRNRESMQESELESDPWQKALEQKLGQVTGSSGGRQTSRGAAAAAAAPAAAAVAAAGRGRKRLMTRAVSAASLLKKSASALLFIKGSKTKRSASAYGSLETGGEEAKKAAEDTPMALDDSSRANGNANDEHALNPDYRSPTTGMSPSEKNKASPPRWAQDDGGKAPIAGGAATTSTAPPPPPPPPSMLSKAGTSLILQAPVLMTSYSKESVPLIVRSSSTPAAAKDEDEMEADRSVRDLRSEVEEKSEIFEEERRRMDLMARNKVGASLGEPPSAASVSAIANDRAAARAEAASAMEAVAKASGSLADFRARSPSKMGEVGLTPDRGLIKSASDQLATRPDRPEGAAPIASISRAPRVSIATGLVAATGGSAAVANFAEEAVRRRSSLTPVAGGPLSASGAKPLSSSALDQAISGTALNKALSNLNPTTLPSLGSMSGSSGELELPKSPSGRRLTGGARTMSMARKSPRPSVEKAGGSGRVRSPSKLSIAERGGEEEDVSESASGSNTMTPEMSPAALPTPVATNPPPVQQASPDSPPYTSYKGPFESPDRSSPSTLNSRASSVGDSPKKEGHPSPAGEISLFEHVPTSSPLKPEPPKPSVPRGEAKLFSPAPSLTFAPVAAAASAAAPSPPQPPRRGFSTPPPDVAQSPSATVRSVVSFPRSPAGPVRGASGIVDSSPMAFGAREAKAAFEAGIVPARAPRSWSFPRQSTVTEPEEEAPKAEKKSPAPPMMKMPTRKLRLSIERAPSDGRVLEGAELIAVARARLRRSVESEKSPLLW